MFNQEGGEMAKILATFRWRLNTRPRRGDDPTRNDAGLKGSTVVQATKSNDTATSIRDNDRGRGSLSAKMTIFSIAKLTHCG